MKALQKKLDKAVATEDFEGAASLRDEIKEARQKINHLPAV
ncbi:MAG: UvrB/UvrC motif-containing protein [Limisphaerales bacterium]